MNSLYADIAWQSLNKHGEYLCGDHVDVLNQGTGSPVLVLADGLGSGVKASILSTLTSKIISTMIAQNMKIEDCVETITSTLPVCSVRGLAYSTFTIIRIIDNKEAEIVEYDNPQVILLRGGKRVPLPATHTDINGKTVRRCRVNLQEGDIFLAFSDGAVHASAGPEINAKWDAAQIAEFMSAFAFTGFSAKTLTKILTDECYRLYGALPGDDTTVCAIKICRRSPVNLLIGPPADREDRDKMFSLFFAKEGKHIVCGGTTSRLAAAFLGKEIKHLSHSDDPKIPPMSEVEGIDLVTEGVITFNKVLSYAQDYLKDNETYSRWAYSRDGASCVARCLFEEATDINFYVGKAVNPAHQNDETINFNIKMKLVEELASALKKMGKSIKVSYF